MGKINEARKKLLKTQLENAVVENPNDDVYTVFVPGAVREFNTVKAGSESEAIEKTQAVLESKIDQLPETEPVTENTEISPDNLKVKIKEGDV